MSLIKQNVTMTTVQSTFLQKTLSKPMLLVTKSSVCGYDGNWLSCLENVFSFNKLNCFLKEVIRSTSKRNNSTTISGTCRTSILTVSDEISALCRTGIAVHRLLIELVSTHKWSAFNFAGFIWFLVLPLRPKISLHDELFKRLSRISKYIDNNVISIIVTVVIQQ